MYKMALWESVSWLSGRLDTHLIWRCKVRRGKWKTSALVLEMLYVSLKILRMHSLEQIGTFNNVDCTQKTCASSTDSFEMQLGNKSHHAVPHVFAAANLPATSLWSKIYAHRLLCRFFTRPLQMLIFRGRQRPESVNSWPTWGEREARKHTQKLRVCCALSLYNPIRAKW